MVQATQRAIADWKPLQQHNITQAMSEVTIDIVGRTLFGVETKRDAATVGTALNAVLAHLSNPLFVAMPWLVKLGFGRAFVRACEQLDALVTSLITQRRAYALDEGDLLGSMIAAMDAGVITERDLRNETLILFLTGHETAAVALPYVFHCIGQNPAVERKLAAELEHVLKGRTPTLDDIPALVYTEQIVKEALRLYPPAWSMGRKAISDVQIGGHIVPKGAQVWMGVWAMQRDPRYFEQPTVFNPDRWNTGGPREKFAYFPFGGGPRLCIGQGFSKTEMVLVLATIAQNFKLRFDELTPLELAPNFTLRTKTPLVATVLPAGKAAAYEAPAPLVSPPAKCPFHAALGLQQKSGNQENQVAEGAR
jgi:cytochrome P450